MTDRSKFEQMLEHLINEDEQKAKELFHDIVVAKSREIYETLLADDFNEGEMPGEMPEEETADMAAAEAAMGGDAADDMLGDIEDDGAEGEEEFGDDAEDGVDLSGGDVEGLQDRVVDLEDALDALRDEFESLMGGDDTGEEGNEFGGDDMDDEQVPEMDGAEMPQEMPAMEVRDDDEEDPDMDEAFIREYVEKVTAKMGDNGQNTKSTVAKPNNMGGTTANITKGFVDNSKGGTQGGLLNPSTKDQNGGNVNVPGGKAGVKHLKTVSAGHGAEKKGAKPDSEKSLLGR
jgi:hypothetical protein